jgi:solute:Na+ symporter, SSS family
MSIPDWIVLVLTLCSIIFYGMWKSRGQKNLESYFLSSHSVPGYIVLFSIMGTQASAITFLSAPGQAYTDGMRFVQYYFGLPLAMIVLCITFVPLYQKLKVFTAYEFLEKRFDRKTRLFTSFLFLLQRGLSTGISIYAPSLILSSLLGWDIYITNIIMGGLLIIYTVSGGSKAVSYTQTQQLIIIFGAMFFAGYMVVHLLPEQIHFTDALKIAGGSGKLNVITSGFENGHFNWKDKYNIWSGLIGGFFLALSYFGTDQSQVGRYISAINVTESRKGLLMNGFIKVPMQFLILLVGILVFTFYTTYKGPVYYNSKLLEKTHQSIYGDSLKAIESDYYKLQTQKNEVANKLLAANKRQLRDQTLVYTDSLKILEQRSIKIRKQASTVIQSANPKSDTNDTNYIFLYFVINNLPKGCVGLIIAVIFLAAWGSIAAALNSLASSSIIDWHRFTSEEKSNDKKQLNLSRMYTLAWGIFSIGIAQVAGNMGSLIEAVNILGSLFYGTILGIFIVAFYLKKIQGNTVFYAALLAEACVILIYAGDIVSFLWLNAIGCFLVILFAMLFHLKYMIGLKLKPQV